MRLLKFIYSGEGKATFLLLKFKLKAPSPHTLSLVSTKDTKAKKKEKKEKTKRREKASLCCTKAILGILSTTRKPFILPNI